MKSKTDKNMGEISVDLRQAVSIKLAQENQDDLIKQINSLGLPKEVSAADVDIRRCFLVGDALTDCDGRFRTEDLPRLLELTHGKPVMVGHNKEKLPIGRFFGGEVVKEEETSFIVPYFYWMRSASFAEDMRVNIDGGIYTEASLAFLFKKLTCSICGEDLRRCEHFPGRVYDGEVCFYWFDEIIRVREGSLVYQGSHPGTGFDRTDSLNAALSAKREDMETKIKSDKSQEGKMITLELTDSMAKEIAVKLGIKEIAEAVDLEKAVGKAVDKAVELQTEIDKLKPKAELGDTFIAGVRDEVKQLETKIAGLSNREPLKGFETFVDKAELETLQDLKKQKEAELEQIAPALKCAKCGSTDITRRQSELSDDDPKTTAPPSRRNLNSVRV